MDCVLTYVLVWKLTGCSLCEGRSQEKSVKPLEQLFSNCRVPKNCLEGCLLSTRCWIPIEVSDFEDLG